MLVRAADFIPKERLARRRLRLLAILDRRETQPRLTRLRPRHRLPKDTSRIQGTKMAADKLGVG